MKKKKQVLKKIILYIVTIIIGIFLGFNIQAELGWKGISISILMLLAGFIMGNLSQLNNLKKSKNEKQKR